jgi:hypothetical protein
VTGRCEALDHRGINFSMFEINTVAMRSDETRFVFDPHDLYHNTIIVLSSILMTIVTTTIILPDPGNASFLRPTIGHTS